MKASPNDDVKASFTKVKGGTNEKLRKLANAPTLEGKDENKVGRIQRKIGRAEEARASSRNTRSGGRLRHA